MYYYFYRNLVLDMPNHYNEITWWWWCIEIYFNKTCIIQLKLLLHKLYTVPGDTDEGSHLPNSIKQKRYHIRVLTKQWAPLENRTASFGLWHSK